MKKEIQNFKIVLENQILRRLLYSNLVSLAGDAASMIVIPLLVLEVTNSASNVVVALLSGTLGTITGAQVILPKLKSIHPSKLCQISNLAQALLTVLIIFASYLPYFEISILPLAFVQYIFVAIARTSTQYIIKEAVEQTSTDLSIHFNSAFEFSTYFGRTVGPLVVGLILWLTNLRTALIFDAATFVASALILRGIVFSYTPPTEKISIRRSLAKYPKFKMLFYMLMPVSNNFAFSIFSVTCYVHLVQNFSLESGEVAVFDAFEALALLLGTLLAPVLVKNKFFYPLAFALVTMGYYGFYLSENVYWFLGSDVLCCLGLSACAIFTRSGLQSMVSREDLSTVMGLRISFINLSKTVSMIFSSLFLLTSTTTNLYLISSLILTGSLIFALTFVLLDRPSSSS